MLFGGYRKAKPESGDPEIVGRVSKVETIGFGSSLGEVRIAGRKG